LHVTENGHTLYGFYDQEEKDLFLQLISVSGVGTSTARMMLSGLKPDEIISSIVTTIPNNWKALKASGKKLRNG
jgi:Holliday junction DNA helicase RuvA